MQRPWPPAVQPIFLCIHLRRLRIDESNPPLVCQPWSFQGLVKVVVFVYLIRQLYRNCFVVIGKVSRGCDDSFALQVGLHVSQSILYLGDCYPSHHSPVVVVVAAATAHFRFEFANIGFGRKEMKSFRVMDD
eukprot:scaffold5388_cov151-Skeletonema_dohrnii-CCMP3373.AAC.5